ncbi:tetratricopeptide repeat protein [uncultured Sphingomonas sp.]|uniref:tetratricopeptide repeat protein n=1 Tax=uncultured Sphingomonas sp. TaxID=158754 RepID=UPI0035CA36E8
MLGYIGVAHDAGYAMRENSARAYALAPGDGRVTGSYAQALLGADATSADWTRAERLARQALRQDPTAVAAVSTLGLGALNRGDATGARRLFAYSERLSRRDLQTQISDIEDAVSRGDVPRALRHYDIALRTSRNAPALLFPILAGAIVNPSVRAALVATLVRQPAWAPHFISYAAGEGSEPKATARLFADLRRARVSVPGTASVALVDRLVGANLFDEAWSYYATIRSGVDRYTLRDPSFAGPGIAGDSTASTFDWQLVDTPGITVSTQRGEGRGVVDFAAPPGIGGPLLRQTQMLLPGTYRLEGHATGIDQPEAAALPYWSLECRDGRELGRIVVPPSRTANGVFAGQIFVPADCPVQTLSLVARSSDAMTGVSGQIDRVRILPFRPTS